MRTIVEAMNWLRLHADRHHRRGDKIALKIKDF
jgi:hypothetical protein